jgi:hypothetical protein
MNTPDTNSWQFLTTLAGIGAVVSFFQTLASGEKVSWGKALGRAGVTAGIALGGQALLIVVPGMRSPPPLVSQLFSPHSARPPSSVSRTA